MKKGHLPYEYVISDASAEDTFKVQYWHHSNHQSLSLLDSLSSKTPLTTRRPLIISKGYVLTYLFSQNIVIQVESPLFIRISLYCDYV